MENWLNPSAGAPDDEVAESVSATTLSNVTPKETATPNSAPVSTQEQPKTDTAPITSKKIDDVASAFDDLFNS